MPINNFNNNNSNSKKALLIGINYIGTDNELKGCINDVMNIKKFLIYKFNFNPNNILVLTDDQVYNPMCMPTRYNILNAMHWLVKEAKAGDSLFFHYSGHGSQQQDTEGDEEDGYDETILPLDFELNGEIVDDQMNAIMVRHLPFGAKLTCIFDCCHSGTALDLPYVYSHLGKCNLKKFNIWRTIYKSLHQMGYYHLTDIHSPEAKLIIHDSIDKLHTTMEAEVRSKLTRGSLGEVIMFSGCKDDQTSADAHVLGYGSTGAMSHALITALNYNTNMTYLQLLRAIRTLLKDKYEQLPQLSCSKPMNINSTFSL
ncbi:peptidase C14 [Neoconidiobolus thromboides FSU 785]|nr:peptidase C14 [Neoconidiobolus thromboides FSU 785]